MAHPQCRAYDLVHIPARAEPAPGAANDKHPDVAPVRELGEQIPQVRVRLEGERVEFGRPVECDCRDSALALEPEVVPLLGQRNRSTKRAHRLHDRALSVAYPYPCRARQATLHSGVLLAAGMSGAGTYP